MTKRDGVRTTVAVCLGALAASGAKAQTWSLTGPTGGDVRSLAASPREPHVVYLGTAEGVLFRSDDSGRRWNRLEPSARFSGMSIDDIVVTPAGDVLIGYWKVAGHGGGVARSADGGKSFKIYDELSGESVRALAIAPNPGAHRGGTLTSSSRERRSARTAAHQPARPPELRNVESLAVDARRSDVIYVGTGTCRGRPATAASAEGVGAGWSPTPTCSMPIDTRAATRFRHRLHGLTARRRGRMAQSRGIPRSSRRTRASRRAVRTRDMLAVTTRGPVGERRGGRAVRPARRGGIRQALVLLPGEGVCWARTLRRATQRGGGKAYALERRLLRALVAQLGPDRRSAGCSR